MSDRRCIIDGCANSVKQNKMCSKHYWREYRKQIKTCQAAYCRNKRLDHPVTIENRIVYLCKKHWQDYFWNRNPPKIVDVPTPVMPVASVDYPLLKILDEARVKQNLSFDSLGFLAGRTSGYFYELYHSKLAQIKKFEQMANLLGYELKLVKKGNDNGLE